ncbi:MAG TPA: alpha/beta hydrolase [Mycobacterium sp.]|nr:alpha/beta hydrolase [Mycobacterium sp.]
MTGQRLTEEVDQPECIRDSCDHGGQWPTHHLVNGVDHLMSVGTIITTDGTDIFYKDWGTGQPIVFSHGWPLSADDWDTQMLFFLQHGYRVIAHDRRGHGRSSQTGDGHDMDHYADDLATLIEHLNLRDAIHVGRSTGGGEVVRYLARHGESRSSKAVLISSVPPLTVQTETNPGGLPKDVFDGFQAQLAANRSEFYRWMAEGALLQFQPTGRGTLRGDHRQLVAQGHDGRREGPLRRHRRLLPPGYPRRADLVGRYCLTTGRDVGDAELGFWHALALWKIAIIAEGILLRAQQDSRNRATSGIPAQQTVTDLVALGHDIAERAGI